MVSVPYGDRVYLNEARNSEIRNFVLVSVPYGDRVYLNPYYV